MVEEKRKYFVIDNMEKRIITYFVAANDKEALEIANDFRFGKGRFALAIEVKVKGQ